MAKKTKPTRASAAAAGRKARALRNTAAGLAAVKAKKRKKPVKKAAPWAKQKTKAAAKKKTKTKKKKTTTKKKTAAAFSPTSVPSDTEAHLPTPSPAGASQQAVSRGAGAALGPFGGHSSAFKDLGQKAYKKLARELRQLERSCRELKSDCAVLCAELTSAAAASDGDLVDTDLRIGEAALALPEFPEKNLKNMGAYLDKAFRASIKKLKTNM
jgi:hypothetical protein